MSNIKTTENQIDHIIDILDDATWLMGRTFSSPIHFIRCSSDSDTTAELQYACNMFNNPQQHYTVQTTKQLITLKSFINNPSNQTINIMCSGNTMILIMHHISMYEASLLDNNYILNSSSYDICPKCFDWFKNNKFRFPHLDIDKSYLSNTYDHAYPRLKFSNGKLFGIYSPASFNFS